MAVEPVGKVFGDFQFGKYSLTSPQFPMETAARKHAR
jgi:hypothetical protein